MSSRADELIGMAERGGRIAAIRDQLGMTAPEFADALNRAASSYGVALGMNDVKVSRLEGGTRGLPAEEAVAIHLVDPDERGIEWLVFGEKRGRSARPVHPSTVRPVPKSQTKPDAGKRAAGSK